MNEWRTAEPLAITNTNTDTSHQQCHCSPLYTPRYFDVTVDQAFTEKDA